MDNYNKYIENNAHINKTYAIVWMHGLGADPSDFAQLGPMLNIEDSFYIVCPFAPIKPVTINMGIRMRSWHDINSLHNPEENNYEGIYESEKFVINIIEELKNKGFEYRNIFLGGFSQGGCMALWVATRLAHCLAGAICISGYIPRIFLEQENTLNDHKNLPIFYGHGKADETVFPEHAQASADWLQAKGYDLKFNWYEMGHEINQELITDLSFWISKLNR
jgi:phospholipase/carboxylesterase